MSLISSLKGKRIFIAGGAGAIGKNLVSRVLKEVPDQIVVLDNFSSGLVEDGNKAAQVGYVNGDIRDAKEIGILFSDYKPQIVFHLAALFANQNSIEHPIDDFDTNARGTLLLLEESRRTGVEAFVYSSSSCVYGHSDLPLDDADLPTSIDTPYAISKGIGELYCRYYFKSHKLPVVIVRIFNSYGPGEYSGRYRNVIPNFISLALQGNALTITGSGDEIRTFTYVDDVVECLVSLIKKDNAQGQVINVASPFQVKVCELAEIVNRLTNNQAGVRFVERRSWDQVSVRKANTRKLMKLVGDYKFIPLEEGVKRTLAWALENRREFIKVL